MTFPRGLVEGTEAPEQAPSTTTDWGSFYSQGSVPVVTSNTPNAPTQYNTQIQSLAPDPVPFQQGYNVQAIQSLATQTQGSATPAEQTAGQGGGLVSSIQPYEDLQAWFNPALAGGFGTPTELRYSAGPGQSNYGPSAIQWSEDANNLALMQQGISPAQMADNSINAVYAFLTDFGVRPEFVTPYVQSRLGLTAADMVAMGYAQDPYGRWILLDFGSAQAGTAAAGGFGYGGSYGSGGGGRGYVGGGSFRSNYTSGLLNWRIGL